MTLTSPSYAVIIQSHSAVCYKPLLVTVNKQSIACSALTLLFGRQEGHLAGKKYEGMVEVGTG